MKLTDDAVDIEVHKLIRKITQNTQKKRKIPASHVFSYPCFQKVKRFQKLSNMNDKTSRCAKGFRNTQ